MIIDEKTSLILEGGGMRGVFTCGVLDNFMDRGIRFPFTIGVSAGACNGLSYMSGQRGRAKHWLYVRRSLLKWAVWKRIRQDLQLSMKRGIALPIKCSDKEPYQKPSITSNMRSRTSSIVPIPSIS